LLCASLWSLLHDSLAGFDLGYWNTYPKNIFLSKTFEEAGQNFTIKMITDSKRCDATFSKEEKKIHIDIRGEMKQITSIISCPHYKYRIFRGQWFHWKGTDKKGRLILQCYGSAINAIRKRTCVRGGTRSRGTPPHCIGEAKSLA